MTTQDAFKFLLHSPYLWSKTGNSKSSRRLYKHRAMKGEWPSIQTMEQMLAHVFQVEQEKTWKLK